MKQIIHFLILCFAATAAYSQTSVSSLNNAQSVNYLVKWNTVTGTPYKVTISSIFDNGNVGIGTNAPSTKLDINGQIKIRGGTPGLGKILISDAAGLATWQTSPWTAGTGTLSTSLWTGIGDQPAESGISLKLSSLSPFPATPGSHDKTILRFNNICGTPTSNTITNWDIWTNQNSFQLKKNLMNWLVMDQNNNLILGSTAQMVVNANGNTGIGTQSPDEKLSVTGNIRLNDSVLYFRYAGDHYHGLGYFGSSNTFADHAVDGPVLFGFASGVLGISYPQNKDILRWDKDYVRIDAKLTALEVTVKTDVWSDFVFDEKYELMPINEIEKYLQLHKHLPEIPAGTDIMANGLNLGEMQNIQMKKIEELTLYIIAMNKEIEDLKSQCSDHGKSIAPEINKGR